MTVVTNTSARIPDAQAFMVSGSSEAGFVNFEEELPYVSGSSAPSVITGEKFTVNTGTPNEFLFEVRGDQFTSSNATTHIIVFR